jgi:hypothetical protein
MDIVKKHNFFSYIKVLKSDDLLKKDYQLYSLLSKTDVLTTDHFAIDNFIEYKRSRNFSFNDPKKYMPGPIVC